MTLWPLPEVEIYSVKDVDLLQIQSSATVYLSLKYLQIRYHCCLSVLFQKSVMNPLISMLILNMKDVKRLFNIFINAMAENAQLLQPQ